MLDRAQFIYLRNSLIFWFAVVLIYSVFGWRFPSAGEWIAPLYLLGIFVYGLCFFTKGSE